MTSAGDELIQMSERLSAAAARADDAAFDRPLSLLLDAANQVGKAWSHSNIGYHSNVYYAELVSPPPGAHFSSEWGLMGTFQGSTGDWREYDHDAVLGHIEKLAGAPDLSGQEADADAAQKIFFETRDDASSVLHAQLGNDEDDYLRRTVDDIEMLGILSYEACVRAQLPSGNYMSRDSTAISQGLRSAPHQEVIARVIAIRNPFRVAGELSSLCRKAARHLARIGGDPAPTTDGLHAGGRVVIGHGHSPLWIELKEYLEKDLHVAWDEFNRVAVAGVATTERLREMLDSSTMAFIVATAEDETSEGLVARQNVVHEIGLFQGHLGFGRAIVLLEEGCSEFSNIHGLGQIRFPAGNIGACFDEVRRVVEREGLL